MSEKSKKIAQHYLTSSVFSSKVLVKWLAIASVIGVIVGCIIALMRLSNARIGKWKFLQSISSIYVDIIRGTPVVVQLMII